MLQGEGGHFEAENGAPKVKPCTAPLWVSLPAPLGRLEKGIGEAAALQVQNLPVPSLRIHRC